MKLATSSLIPEIDRYAAEHLGIPVKDLMDRSGEAVAKVIYERVPKGREVLIFAGTGNNGGDGYATATKLIKDYDVTVFSMFPEGPKTEESRYFKNLFLSMGGVVEEYVATDRLTERIHNAGCVIDAIFGTGFHGEIPESVKPLARAIHSAVNTRKVAIDVPLGINADDGSVMDDAATYVGVTVCLSMIKTGLVSYPAKGYVGEIVFDDLGLPWDTIYQAFDIPDHLIEKVFVKLHLPKRADNSNKGTFGKLLCITGSEKYRGAAALSLEGALRGGAGYVTYLGEESLVSELRSKYPEALYEVRPKNEVLSDEDIEKIVALSARHSATLIGPGSDNSKDLYRLVKALLLSEGGTLILDADAINSLTWDIQDGLHSLKNAKRKIVLTPHPLEYSRLAQESVTDVQLHRIERAKDFAKEYGCTLVLKGAGTIVTDGAELFINHTGSSALAKAGSGDVLAGVIASLITMGTRPLDAAALAVYFHGLAADHLAEEFSSFGVIPSDLPMQIAREIAKIENDNSTAAHTLDRSYED